MGTAPLHPELANVPLPQTSSSVLPYLKICPTLGLSPSVYHRAGIHPRCRRRFLCEVCRSRVLSSPYNQPVTLHCRRWYTSEQVCNRSLATGNGHPEQFVGDALCKLSAYCGPFPDRLSGHDSSDSVITTRPFHTTSDGQVHLLDGKPNPGHSGYRVISPHQTPTTPNASPGYHRFWGNRSILNRRYGSCSN